MSLIVQEFQRLEELKENKLNNVIISYLEKTYKEIQFRGICNPRGPFKKSLIHFAAMGDCTELLQHLLDFDAPVDDRDQNKRTPLSWAAEYGSFDATKILLKNGAKVNSLDDMYTSPSLVESHLLVVRDVSKLDCKVWPKLRTFQSKSGGNSFIVWDGAAGSFQKNTSTTSQRRRAFEQPTCLLSSNLHSPGFIHNNSPALPVRSHVDSSVLRLLSGVAASETVSYFGR
ncbi:uncharacterized protein N7469_002011 [Penicillium citrinum]|uniref:Ankyrin repeat protein n=1 Tax=Penicillium citrinum TaxID=5077 RepID=A0A9W9P9V4_PENCI|nr:uncharacterized protein N7469_002011 [Penicillium citrinum]KAJ5240420.1 hypothetical protein N7469_002011 [Penicillium citrinum]